MRRWHRVKTVLGEILHWRDKKREEEPVGCLYRPIRDLTWWAITHRGAAKPFRRRCHAKRYVEMVAR